MKVLIFGILLLLVGCALDIEQPVNRQIVIQPEKQPDQRQVIEGKPYGSEYKIAIELVETPGLNKPTEILVTLEPLFTRELKIERQNVKVTFSYWSNEEDALEISPYKTVSPMDYTDYFKYGYTYFLTDDLTLTNKKQALKVTITPKKVGCYHISAAHGYPFEAGNFAASVGTGLEITEQETRVGNDISCAPKPKVRCIGDKCGLIVPAPTE